MKKSKIFIDKQSKRKLIVLGTIMVVIIATIVIATTIYFNARKNTVDVTSHGYETSINDIEMNTLVVELTENEIDENTIEENNVVNNNIANNPTANNDTKNKNNNGAKYKLDINCTANVVNVYEKDENGDYTKCVKVMLCSVGRATPHSGTYSLKKYGGSSWRWRALFGNVYGQYATQITGNILFHSVPYTKPNNSNLEYWEYDKLGTSASMGCVRLTVQNAKWIWDNCAAGTKVRFYDDTNPGPLGKPTEAKISWNEECRNWDPTDPDGANPWRNYNNQESSNQEDNNLQEDNDNQESNKPQEENKTQENDTTQEENAATEKPNHNSTADNQQSQDNDKNQIKENNTENIIQNNVDGKGNFTSKNTAIDK